MSFKSFGAVSYSPSIVTVPVSVAICEIFSVKEWCDLENRVRVRSRSFARPRANAATLEDLHDTCLGSGHSPSPVASLTLEEWTRTFSPGQQRSCFSITVFYGVRVGEQKVCEWGPKIWKNLFTL